MSTLTKIDSITGCVAKPNELDKIVRNPDNHSSQLINIWQRVRRGRMSFEWVNIEDNNLVVEKFFLSRGYDGDDFYTELCTNIILKIWRRKFPVTFVLNQIFECRIVIFLFKNLNWLSWQTFTLLMMMMKVIQVLKCCTYVYRKVECEVNILFFSWDFYNSFPSSAS